MRSVRRPLEDLLADHAAASAFSTSWRRCQKWSAKHLLGLARQRLSTESVDRHRHRFGLE
jgi:hypothetical protein